MTLLLRFFEGGNAVSDFKVQQLLPRLQAVSDKINGLSARFVHLASFDAEPDAATLQRVGELMTYGEPARGSPTTARNPRHEELQSRPPNDPSRGYGRW